MYVQIATSQKYAVRCGATTKNTCFSHEFMDGNRFLITRSSTVASGVEVQISPDDNVVITAIARNTRKGKVLDLHLATWSTW